MYGVGGERYLPEHDIDTLDGYRGSRPVRVGNAAAEQFQLDVYGYLLDTAWLYHRAGGDISDSFWDLLRGAVEVVAEQWTRPDEGIWEVRGGPRHFVSSKIMAWVAVDRAIRLGTRPQPPRRHRRVVCPSRHDPSSHRDARRPSDHRCVRASVRQHRARRVEPARRARALPARRRCTRQSNDRRHDRRNSRPTASSTGTSTRPTRARWTGSPGARPRSRSAASGSSTTSRSPATRSRARELVRAHAGVHATTSASSRRRSTRSRASFAATSRRRSVTSGSSAPRSTCNEPNAGGPARSLPRDTGRFEELRAATVSIAFRAGGDANMLVPCRNAFSQ